MYEKTYLKLLFCLYITSTLCSGGILLDDEGEYDVKVENPPNGKGSYFTKRTNGTEAPFYKCNLVGYLAIRFDCEHYFVCTKVGNLAGVYRCPEGKKFDMKIRMCMDEGDVECDNSKICPSDGIRYVEENLNYRNDYLQCMNGVPFPRSCLKGLIYHTEEEKCVERHQ